MNATNSNFQNYKITVTTNSIFFADKRAYENRSVTCYGILKTAPDVYQVFPAEIVIGTSKYTPDQKALFLLQDFMQGTDMIEPRYSKFGKTYHVTTLNTIETMIYNPIMPNNSGLFVPDAYHEAIRRKLAIPQQLHDKFLAMESYLSISRNTIGPVEVVIRSTPTTHYTMAEEAMSAHIVMSSTTGSIIFDELMSYSTLPRTVYMLEMEGILKRYKSINVARAGIIHPSGDNYFYLLQNLSDGSAHPNHSPKHHGYKFSYTAVALTNYVILDAPRIFFSMEAYNEAVRRRLEIPEMVEHAHRIVALYLHSNIGGELIDIQYNWLPIQKKETYSDEVLETVTKVMGNSLRDNHNTQNLPNNIIQTETENLKGTWKATAVSPDLDSPLEEEDIVDLKLTKEDVLDIFSDDSGKLKLTSRNSLKIKFDI